MLIIYKEVLIKKNITIMNIPTKDFPLTFLVVQVYQQQIFSAVCMCVCVTGGWGEKRLHLSSFSNKLSTLQNSKFLFLQKFKVSFLKNKN